MPTVTRSPRRPVPTRLAWASGRRAAGPPATRGTASSAPSPATPTATDGKAQPIHGGLRDWVSDQGGGAAGLIPAAPPPGLLRVGAPFINDRRIPAHIGPRRRV